MSCVRSHTINCRSAPVPSRMIRSMCAISDSLPKFETAFTEGPPVIDICAFAKDHNVDLIITSTHGLTGFTHVLIGSIAEQVVRHAPCSVLVVPSHPQLRAAHLAKSATVNMNRLASQRQSASVLKSEARQKITTPRRMDSRRKTEFRESHYNR